MCVYERNNWGTGFGFNPSSVKPNKVGGRIGCEALGGTSSAGCADAMRLPGLLHGRLQ